MAGEKRPRATIPSTPSPDAKAAASPPPAKPPSAEVKVAPPSKAPPKAASKPPSTPTTPVAKASAPPPSPAKAAPKPEPPAKPSPLPPVQPAAAPQPPALVPKAKPSKSVWGSSVPQAAPPAKPLSLREIQEQQQKEAAEQLIRTQVEHELAAEQQAACEDGRGNSAVWVRNGPPSLKQIMQEEAASQSEEKGSRRQEKPPEKKKAEPKKREAAAPAPTPVPHPLPTTNTVWGTKPSMAASLQQIQKEQTESNGKLLKDEESGPKSRTPLSASARVPSADDGLFWTFPDTKEKETTPSSRNSKKAGSALDKAEFPSLGGDEKKEKKEKKTKKAEKEEDGPATLAEELRAVQMRHQDELVEWAKVKLNKIKKKNVDDSILISALMVSNSADEVRSYVSEYLGRSAPATAFADEFISLKSFGLGDMFEGGTSAGGGAGALQTQKKRKKGKSANDLLNFSVAPPTGEIETI
eukprot:GGOE01018449.1.p1 GENE.GGOE01018449.1~~GGOE01018449.1.p1  ORF type:complete len:525 (+),score=126.72 GGOE01018449.1:173-1576(+)